MFDGEERFTFSECLDCGAYYLHPRISARNLKIYYPDWYLPYRGADAWGKFASFVTRSQQKTDRKRVRLCKKYAPRRKEAVRLLDVGCGKPDFLAECRKRTSWQLKGIDFTDAGWQHETYKQLDLVEGDVQRFETDEKFDLITMWHYLEHDYDPPRTLQKVAELLRPGGGAIIEVPDPKSLTQRWQKEFWEGWHTPRHTVLYTGKSFEMMCEASGLHLKKWMRYGTLDAFSLWWMGTRERSGIDWQGSMEPEFWPLVWKKVYTAPLFALERVLPLGIQVAVLERAR